jgi:hydroxyquinol 1,2-dioxygenase
VPNAPSIANGGNMAEGCPGIPCFVTGMVRGLYRSQPDGSYAVRTVAPIGYTIPMDGTVGELVNRAKISHMRPAHIHFAITARGYHGCVTHLFQKGDGFIETDVVYGVKEPLIVEFLLLPR